MGIDIILDGMLFDFLLILFGLMIWNVHIVEVILSVYKIEVSELIGVIAYGYDCDVSYVYSGGFNLES